MNRRDLFRLAGAVAVAPRAMLAAPVAPAVWSSGWIEVHLPTHFVGRVEYMRGLIKAGVIDGPREDDDDGA